MLLGTPRIHSKQGMIRGDSELILRRFLEVACSFSRLARWSVFKNPRTETSFVFASPTHDDIRNRFEESVVILLKITASVTKVSACIPQIKYSHRIWILLFLYQHPKLFNSLEKSASFFKVLTKSHSAAKDKIPAIYRYYIEYFYSAASRLPHLTNL